MVSKVEATDKVICVIGLGYVGLPLLQEFSKHFSVIGYEVDSVKVNELRSRGFNAEITSDQSLIKKADIVFCKTFYQQPKSYFWYTVLVSFYCSFFNHNF